MVKSPPIFGVAWKMLTDTLRQSRSVILSYVSGQLSHDDKRTLIAPAALDESGKPADFLTMEEQMRVTYANAAKLLARFGATLDHVW
jgi:enamine deaminase RidA (YjgF/YER057c/UK114 family)